MRIRVLAVLGSLLLVIVVLVSSVLMQSVSSDATADVQVNRLSSLNRFVQVASHASGNDDLEMLQLEMDTYSQLYNEGLLIVVDDRQLISGDIRADDAAVKEMVGAAALNLDRTEIPEISPLTETVALISRPFGNSAQVLGSVTMQVNLEPARARVLQASAFIIVLTLSIGFIFLLLADRLATWVLRPLHRLDDSVQLLTQTHQPIPLVEQGPPELRALSRSVSSMAQTMATSLQQQQELIAETSHQLRNPVAALRLRVDLLRMRLTDEASLAGLHAVENELARLEMLLDGVLRLASAEHRLTEQKSDNTDTEVAQPQKPTHAYQILAEEIERQSAMAQKTGSTLSLEGDSKSASEDAVWCHEFDLQQMVSELLENALKYAPGTEIKLALQTSPTTVDIVICDQGPGLGKEELERVGERFWRAESVRGTPGTGLGLAIVDRLARANSGQLIVESNGDTGLKVIIRLPRAQTPQGADHEE
ncbi:sensor histidine kinase [Glutamicibacter sp.]|uniref:sensor histidine kinase n=1 Tax=Glutamicibacter sp. TaxID=1931995 RepID=UPI002FE1ED13